MSGGDCLVLVSLIYGAASGGLAVLLRTLYRNGAVFLRDVFPDSPGWPTPSTGCSPSAPTW